MLLIVVHHTAFDGWSAGVLVRDLPPCTRPRSPACPPRCPSCRCSSRTTRCGSGTGCTARCWPSWRILERGAGRVQTIPFPTDRPRPVLDTFDGAIAERLTDRGRLDDLRELAARGHHAVRHADGGPAGPATPLHGQTDLVVGTASANRGRAELAPLIGFLVNTLPIRGDLGGDPSFTQLMARLKDAAIGRSADQDLPFGKLVDTLHVDATQPGAAVPDRTVPTPSPTGPRCPAARGVLPHRPIWHQRGQVRSDPPGRGARRRPVDQCWSRGPAFRRGDVDRLLGHLEVLLRGAAADPSARLSRLPVLTEPELQAELADGTTPGRTSRSRPSRGVRGPGGGGPAGPAAEFEGRRWPTPS